jgi:hypothetical protein
VDAESYLHWLRRIDLEAVGLPDLVRAVDTILQAMRRELEACGEAPGEMLQALLEIESDLRQDRLPLDLLEDFRRDFLDDLDPYEAADAVLERELREIAAGIAPSRWGSETYQRLEQAIDGFLEGGDEDALWTTVDDLEELIERVARSYANTAILPKEVTMESRITHRLLCEGIDQWRTALALLRDGESEDEPDWSKVLEQAEQGNRLLVCVQIYQSRLQSALTTY